jgi:formamidopyrimidine-DNA glycosylase
MCRGIRPIVGSTIKAAERLPSPRKPIGISPAPEVISRRVVGQKINDIQRAGKRVVLRIGADECLIFEPRMTGLVLIDQPPTLEHLRFGLELQGRKVKQLLFWDRRGLGRVMLLKSAEFERKILQEKLGPDALAITEEQFYAALHPRKTAIKVALLNQGLIAGIGNLYASELLHVARVHPATPASRLTRAKMNRIHAAMRVVLEEAIKFEGSTLADGTYRNALNQVGDYQSHHRVYDRAGEPCPAGDGPCCCCCCWLWLWLCCREGADFEELDKGRRR